MADYTSLFEITGQFVKLDRFFTLLAETDAEFASGGDTFTSLDRFQKDLVALLNQSAGERRRWELLDSLQQWAEAVGGWRNAAKADHDTFLLDRAVAEINSAATGIDDLLADLRRAMTRDSESVTRNLVSVGSVSADGANVGTGAVAVSANTVLPDGAFGADERIRTQDLELVCTADAPHDGRSAGDEQFELRADVSGTIVIPVIAATVGATADPAGRNRVLDGSFETFSASVFAQWPASSGASLFTQSTATKYLGSGAMDITGTGALAGRAAQSLDSLDPALAPQATMALAANIYASGISAGSVTLRLAGTGYTSSGIVIDDATASGAWLADEVFIALPKSIPADLALEIVVSADFAGTAYVDNVALAEATEFATAGIRLIVRQGDADFLAGPQPDRFSFATTSDDAGIIQTAFRDLYGVALPSVASGATIPDSLAQ